MSVRWRMRKRSGAIVAILIVVGAVAAALAQASRPASVVAPTASTSGSPLVPAGSPPTWIVAASTSTPTLVSTPISVAVLRPDGMATIAAPGGVVVWSAPGTGKAKALTPTLPTGSRLFVTRGPHHAHGFDWWEVQVDFRGSFPPLFGWIHAIDRANRPALTPFAPACPLADATLDSSFVKDLGTLQALACFGGRDITVRGDLACYDAAVDWAVGGASWMGPNYTCSLDGALYLEGSVIADLDGGRRPLTGSYEIRGHFDDPESTGCSWIPFGTFTQAPSGHPDPGAVMACRQSFVVTAAAKLP